MQRAYTGYTLYFLVKLGAKDYSNVPLISFMFLTFLIKRIKLTKSIKRMSDKLDKINKLEENIIAMEKELEKYQELFLEDDGIVDSEEQSRLDTMFATINDTVAELFKRKAALPPEITRAVFNAGKYEKKNYAPPTRLGLFDVSLNPKNGRLEVLSKLKFNFIDGELADFYGKKGESHTWSKNEKKKWQGEYVALIEGRWGGKYHFIHPDMKDVHVYVDVEIEAVDAGWHYDLQIKKVPKGVLEISSVSIHDEDPSTDEMTSTLDSNDLTFVTKDESVKDKQKGAIHEYGHMIGLDDEYEDSDPGTIWHETLVRDALGTVLVEGNYKDVMSVGNHIEKQHYVTFLQALKDITNLKKWQFKK